MVIMPRIPPYYATPNRLKTEAQMMALLKERTQNRSIAAGSPPVEASVMSGLASQQTVTADGGSQQLPTTGAPFQPTRSAPPLEWQSPVKNPDGTGHLKDLTGTYTVLKERRSDGEGWQYLAFRGSTVLAPCCSTAECAKAHCEADGSDR